MIESDRELTLGLVRPLVTNVDLRILEHNAASSSLSQVLPLLHSSFDVRSYGTLGGISLPTFRGLPSEYISVYRNGIRLTNAQNSLTDMERYTSRTSSHVSILSSTESAMYASGVAGAAVVIESEPLRYKAYSAGVSLETYDDASSLNDKEYYFRGAEPMGISFIAFSANYRTTNGAYPFYQRSSRSYIDRANNDAYLGIVELEPKIILGEDESISGLLTMSEAERGVPGPNTVDGMGASTPQTRQYDKDWLTGLFYRSQVFKDFYHEASVSWQSQYETYTDPIRNFDDKYRNELLGGSYRSRFQVASDFILYADVAANSNRLVSNQHEGPGKRIVRDIISTALSSKYSFSDAWSISGSARLEKVSDVQAVELSPAANIQYTTGGFEAVASFSSFFHPPTFNQLYWRQGGDSTLKPEYGESFELRSSYLFHLSDETSLDLRAALFLTDIRDQIIWTMGSGGFAIPVQMQQIRTQGVEFNASMAHTIADDQKVDIRLGLTYLDKVNLVESSLYYGKSLPYAPPLRLNAVAIYDLKDVGSITAILWHRALQYSDFANNASVSLPTVTTFDLHLRLTPVEFLAIALTPQLSAINLTNEQYEDALSYPLPGRIWKLSFDFTYPQ